MMNVTLDLAVNSCYAFYENRIAFFNLQSIFFKTHLTDESRKEVNMSLDTFQNLPESKQKLIIDKGIEVFSKFSFTDASTDLITQKAGISKGLLFHYFGSKKNFYLYLLDYAINLLTQASSVDILEHKNFYEILFDSMDKKYRLIMDYPNEMHFTNLASKETSKQVVKEKQELIGKYMIEVQKNSSKILSQAIQTLNLRNDVDMTKLTKGLSMYVNTIIMQYLQIYKDRPEMFFANFDQIKIEIKDYIDLILQGVEEKND